MPSTIATRTGTASGRLEAPPVLNYFNYFTEVEERFQKRRGSLLMLSTLDWALIETWREAGLPLEAVLGGIDAAFDKYDARKAGAKRGLRKVNGLAWCAQEVMASAERMAEAATGMGTASAKKAEVESGFEPGRVAGYLRDCAGKIEAANAGGAAGQAQEVAKRTAARLREIAGSLRGGDGAASAAPPGTEDIEMHLTVLEEKLFAALLADAAEEELVALKQQAARELAPYRGKMAAAQLRQVEQQFLRKRLLEARRLPRLSLFYMGHA